MLDECFGLLKQNRGANYKIGNELDNQNKHLDDLGNQMSNVKQKVDKTNIKLDQYNQGSSNTWLIIVICIEIIILFLVFIVL